MRASGQKKWTEAVRVGKRLHRIHVTEICGLYYWSGEQGNLEAKDNGPFVSERELLEDARRNLNPWTRSID